MSDPVVKMIQDVLFPQDDSPGTPKKKKEVKKKFKLELHEDQLFLDGNEVRRV